MIPTPIEQLDPELDALLKVWVEQGLDHSFAITPKGYADKRRWPVQRFVTVSCDVGRNEPCPCGSGKKLKRCCLTLE